MVNTAVQREVPDSKSICKPQNAPNGSERRPGTTSGRKRGRGRARQLSWEERSCPCGRAKATGEGAGLRMPLAHSHLPVSH